MPLDYTVVVAFFIGLLSTLHCLGMCSGIIGALTFSLPETVHKRRRRLLPFVLGYNFGRIASYTFAGGVSASILGGLFDVLSPATGHTLLRLMAAAVLLVIGLYLAGWLPMLALLERVGRPVWQRLEPHGRRLLPVRSPFHAVLFGAVWGWLPCGLVYSTLIWAASSGSAAHGALLMLAFGLGTLPTVLTAGILTSWVARIRSLPHLRRGAGVALVAVALATVVYGIAPHEYHKHEEQHDIHTGRDVGHGDAG